MITGIVGERGQITIPKDIRKRLGIEPKTPVAMEITPATSSFPYAGPARKSPDHTCSTIFKKRGSFISSSLTLSITRAGFYLETRKSEGLPLFEELMRETERLSDVTAATKSGELFSLPENDRIILSTAIYQDRLFPDRERPRFQKPLQKEDVKDDQCLLPEISLTGSSKEFPGK